jgi:hypothetical protein
MSDFKVVADGVIKQALVKGIRFGSIQIADAVHMVANVNNDKDQERHEQDKPSAGPGATVVHGGKRLVTRRRVGKTPPHCCLLRPTLVYPRHYTRQGYRFVV